MIDLDDLFELEAAELSEDALRRLPGAGEGLLEWLLQQAFEALGMELHEAIGKERPDAIEAGDFLELLGLRQQRGRPPKSGSGSRFEAVKRLRTLAALAAIAHAPRPVLEFYSSAAAAIEAGAEPLAALSLRRRRGRPPAEGEFTRFARDHQTESAFTDARKGEIWDKALEKAGGMVGSSTGRGRSAATVRRARRRLRRKPPIY